MAVNVDIFNPQISVVAKGLAGKCITIYSSNSRGKTYVATHLSKPFVIACESGLNALNGVRYNRVNNWADMKKLVKQFTSKSTYEKARELYDTIVIDEMYAASIFCQDFVMATYGNGAMTLSDSNDPRKNLYQLYEKEFFRLVNALLSCDYTVVFIGHEQQDSKTGYISPKGDRRCVQPILDNSDFVIYLTSNGVDENGKVKLSTAHFAEGKTEDGSAFFARSRFTHCATELTPFTAEGLEKVVRDAIEAEEKESGIAAVDYEVQKEQNISIQYDFDEVMEEVRKTGEKLATSGHMDELTEIVEDVLGKDKKVSECNKKQIDAVLIILDNLKDKVEELGL